MPLLTAALIAAPFLFPWSGGPLLNAWQLTASWACLAALLMVLRRGRARPDGRVLGWLALVFVSVAGSRGFVVEGWASACTAIAAAAAAALAGSRLAAERKYQRAFAWALLAAGLLSAVLGLLQYYGLAEPLAPWTTSPELGQAFGNLRQRNQFATLLSMALVALLWLGASRIDVEAGTPGTTAGNNPATIAAALLLLIAQAASTSRTGLLQLVAIVGVAGFIAWRERRPAGAESTPEHAQLRLAAASGNTFRLPSPCLLLALIPLYFLASWLLPHLAGGGVEGMAHRLREGAPPGHSRLVLWGDVLELIARHPWVGWGWGELKFAHYSSAYAGPRFVEILDNAHNLPLHLAVELGIPLALLICAGFGWLVLAARPWRETDPDRLMAWGVLGLIVLHSMLEYPLWYGPFQLVFGLCLGLLWPAPAPAAAPAERAIAWPAIAIAAALLAIVAYAGWDYMRISQVFLARDERLEAYRDDPWRPAARSWLFEDAVDFARLSLTPVTQANAAEVHALAERGLHFSPEPVVIEKLIDSALLLGLDDEAAEQAARFKAAFPADYSRWAHDEDEPAQHGDPILAPPDPPPPQANRSRGR